MQIKINANNEIISYAIVGSFENGITVEIPESVLNDNPLSYLYQDWQFVKNANYSPPTETEKTVEEKISELVEKATFFDEAIAELMFNI